MRAPTPVRDALRQSLRTDLWVASGVTSLGSWCTQALGKPGTALPLAVLFCGTVIVYNLDHWRDERAAPPSHGRALPGWLRLSLLALAGAALAATFAAEPTLLVRSAPAGVIGLAYGARTPGGRRLKDVPGAKAWIVACAVTQACVFVPPGAMTRDAAWWSVATFVLALTALNAHCFDLRDVLLDEAAGTPTWASRRGAQSAHRLLQTAAVAGSAAAALAAWLGWLPWSAPGSLALAAVSLVWVRPGASPERFGVVVDGWLWLPATLGAALVWL